MCVLYVFVFSVSDGCPCLCETGEISAVNRSESSGTKVVNWWLHKMAKSHRFTCLNPGATHSHTFKVFLRDFQSSWETRWRADKRFVFICSPSPVWFTKLAVLTTDKICSANPQALNFNPRCKSPVYLFGPDGRSDLRRENVVLEPAGMFRLHTECPNYCLTHRVEEGERNPFLGNYPFNIYSKIFMCPYIMVCVCVFVCVRSCACVYLFLYIVRSPPW